MTDNAFRVTTDQLLAIVNATSHNVDEAVPVLRWDPVTQTWVIVWEIPPHWLTNNAPSRTTIPDEAVSPESLKTLVNRLTVDSTSGPALLVAGAQLEYLAGQYVDEAGVLYRKRLHDAAIQLTEAGFSRISLAY